ncbi:helix-turn-helix domain-containing protein [Kiritimatiellaeota bacterium B1221]|nr:helix-turn-helix domain-containing protein [Kiritimatiellaeota bacterium B1221]
MTNSVKSPPEKLQKKDFFADASLPLQVLIRDPQPEFPLHGHDFHELVIILGGTAIHAIDGQRYPVRSGDAFVISPRQAHQYLELCDLSLVNILFDKEGLAMSAWDIRALPGFHALFFLEPAYRSQHNFGSRLQLSPQQLQTVLPVIRQLEAEIRDQPGGYRVMAKGAFMQLCVHLSRWYSDNIHASESLDLLRIGKAIAYLETHYAEKITLTQLAATSHLSERQFCRIFKQCLGRSPIEHLLEVRIQQASTHLRESAMSVTEIAFACGFSDGNYFTRSFKKHLHQSPTQYRQKAHALSMPASDL